MDPLRWDQNGLGSKFEVSENRKGQFSWDFFFNIFGLFLSSKLCFKGGTFAEHAMNYIKYNILCKNNDYCNKVRKEKDEFSTTTKNQPNRR